MARALRIRSTTATGGAVEATPPPARPAATGLALPPAPLPSTVPTRFTHLRARRPRRRSTIPRRLPLRARPGGGLGQPILRRGGLLVPLAALALHAALMMGGVRRAPPLRALRLQPSPPLQPWPMYAASHRPSLVGPPSHAACHQRQLPGHNAEGTRTGTDPRSTEATHITNTVSYD